VVQLQVDVVLLGSAAAALADLDGHGTRDDVPGGRFDESVWAGTFYLFYLIYFYLFLFVFIYYFIWAGIYAHLKWV
jgi:hypothetical protein